MFRLGRMVGGCLIILLVLLTVGPEAVLAGNQFQMEGFAGADLNDGVATAYLSGDAVIELALVAVLVGGAVLLVRWMVRKSREQAEAVDLTAQAVDERGAQTVLEFASMVPAKTFQMGQWPLP